ncbi:LysM peptidoglycan-binding and 3D domain-containing protein [Oceanobacillus polygoni]|uniref:3D (Asp-Asp-Asp) domain-containing protein n=1 Tax=Oceanobacillus polygoni TaxID=1235259 RepID=A0A9X0YUT7_9BACI|nr:3D domain-containing protein [Oceanobacillus polygoni]MBP2077705.1 3D (Asp-Asp-Asp) domain-containing protein [Oceanobacillus polygoni]
MKKLVALIIGLIIIGVSATTVSAAADYEVKKGDNLWTIANNNNTTVEKLKDINDLDSSMIHPKQTLKLNEEKPEYYTVEKGDSLGEISRSYGDDVTVGDLKAWNNLNSDLIIVGQQLVVNGASELNTEQVATEQVEADSTIEIKEPEPENEPKQEPENEPEEATEDEVVTLEVEEEATTSSEDESAQPNGRTISVEATAYTAYCSGCSGITATGVNLKANPHEKVIAVDPNVIPLGTRVFVEGYGYAVAADTGGAIKGNKIDIHVPTKDQAYDWGRRVVEVTIVD